jgi:hypothetical protein
MPLNRDFRDLFAALNAEGVRYLLVGGYAYSFYVEPRFTKDLDVWVEASPEAAPRVLRALLEFGAPAELIEEQDFAEPRVTLQLGVPPNRIDVLTALSGLAFEEAWANRVETPFGDQRIWVIGRDDLAKNKRASGRDQDLVDLKKLLAQS